MNKKINPFDALIPQAMAQKAEEVGIVKVAKDPFQSFYLAITAGIFIAIAFVFYTTVTIGTGNMPFGIAKLIGGLAFSIGLILVVICGGELFTSSVLTTIARASGRISTSQLVRNWLTVYLGNMVGTFLFVGIIWFAQQHLLGGGEWGLNAMVIAQHKLTYSFSQAVALGLLCNLMVCLAVWMTFSCRSATDKVMVMILPVAMFVACGFEHSIANMFMIPMAIVIKNCASPEFWAMVGYSPADFADLTTTRFIVNNLLPVTLGNIIGGGLLVGMTYWAIYRRSEVKNING
ncbi:formate transporter FocA [Pseudoalteromonas sp. SCSIO 43088]|uniref:formate transporter FocA n=1 Tax=Pseudoalteromonas sp. SCSIO 43088 TaxID=2822846 RepID=UPI00202ACA79|nr:formate transporter FocA [Pseudoalteromonas sp. SCSIO 43088]URQ85943.1 formate transporter FocA [Pseudoalteromonas sp. SCSIO 43088]